MSRLVNPADDNDQPPLYGAIDTPEVEILQATPGQSQQDLDYFESAVIIPKSEGNYGFSWRKLWAFTGPGFLMSIAYLDPGNIESDLQAGSIARYHLLWLLCWSTIFGLFVQILAARIGTVSGLHLAELCHRKFHRVPRILLWLLCEVAIIGSDMQEVIGTAISLYLLSNGAIPLYAGVLITIFDTFTFLFLDGYGLRKLEGFFGLLITTMAITFGYEFFTAQPDYVELIKGVAIPWCSGCQKGAFTQAVGIIGAIIMPHNLYLHSALVKSRKIDRKDEREVKDANRYVAIESAVALGVSLIINIMVTAVFAQGLFSKTNRQVRDICDAAHMNGSIFDGNDDDFVDADLNKAGIFLGCAFGLPALYIWAVGIFAAGQSSTMTGTYAGQFVMEGFLHINWARWKRVLVTRAIAIAPTLGLALSLRQMNDLTGLNDLLNTLMSLMLPFAVLPLMMFSASPKVMGTFVTGFWVNVVLWIMSFGLITMNSVFVVIFIGTNVGWTFWSIIIFIPVAVFYMGFIFYLLEQDMDMEGIEREEEEREREEGGEPESSSSPSPSIITPSSSSPSSSSPVHLVQL